MCVSLAPPSPLHHPTEWIASFIDRDLSCVFRCFSGDMSYRSSFPYFLFFWTTVPRNYSNSLFQACIADVENIGCSTSGDFPFEFVLFAPRKLSSQ
jgi:hypothetical protein